MLKAARSYLATALTVIFLARLLPRMGLLASLLLSPWTYLICLAVAVPLLYLIDPLRINWVPGPLLAKVSPLWLFWQARRYRRYKAVHAAHAKYGTFVRISTDHVSIASAEAIPLVYGHGTGTLKAPYYDAFVSIHRGLFSTRDRAEHTRKRKNISHIFSHQNVREFEPYIHANLSLFLNQMSTMVTHASDQIARFDFFPWATYLSFDIIGDLAFGEPFGFIKAGKDHNDAIRILTDRGEWSATVGTMPYIKPWTPYMVWDSFFPKGLTAVKELGQIAITAVEKRLKKGSNRRDVLSFLINARDCQGNPMPDNELKAEAQTQLIAGSDTTANALTSIIDVLCRNPVEYEKLNNSIDDMMQQIGIERDDERLATLAEVQYNKELISCIWESLRIQPVSAMGLPRSVPAGGLDVCGKHFKEGTVLSVPAYTIHHDAKRFPDPYTFKPSRFIKDPPSDKEFVPFSYGPRACVGRNVALMELQTVLANLLYRFKFERQDGNKHATVFREGFILKPTELLVSMTRRC